MSVLICEHCGARSRADALKCASCGAVTLRLAEGELDPPAAPAPRGWAGCFAVIVALSTVAALGIGLATVIGVVLRDVQAPVPVTPPPGPVGLRVGVDPDAPPFLSRSGDGWEGFEYALISAIGDSLGRPVEIVPVGYDALLGAVGDGRVSLGVAQLPPHPTPGVVWSRSYLQYALCLVVRDGDARTSIGAFAGARVGRYADPTAAAVVDAAGAVPVVYADSGYFADLDGGRLDAVVYDCPLARHELKAHPRLVIADDHLGLATYSIAVTASDPALAADVDRVLVDLGRQGLFVPLAQRWLGGGPPRDFEAAAGRVVVVGAGEDLPAVADRALGPGHADDLAAWNADILGSGRDVWPGLMLRVR